MRLLAGKHPPVLPPPPSACCVQRSCARQRASSGQRRKTSSILRVVRWQEQNWIHPTSPVALAGPPCAKRIALSAITLESCRLPCTSEYLHLCLTGGWVSACMYRRPCVSILNSAFHLVDAAPVARASSRVLPLPRLVADELVLTLLCATSLWLTYQHHGRILCLPPTLRMPKVLLLRRPLPPLRLNGCGRLPLSCQNLQSCCLVRRLPSGVLTLCAKRGLILPLLLQPLAPRSRPLSAFIS